MKRIAERQRPPTAGRAVPAPYDSGWRAGHGRVGIRALAGQRRNPGARTPDRRPASGRERLEVGRGVGRERRV